MTSKNINNSYLKLDLNKFNHFSFTLVFYRNTYFNIIIVADGGPQ